MKCKNERVKWAHISIVPNTFLRGGVQQMYVEKIRKVILPHQEEICVLICGIPIWLHKYGLREKKKKSLHSVKVHFDFSINNAFEYKDEPYFFYNLKQSPEFLKITRSQCDQLPCHIYDILIITIISISNTSKLWQYKSLLKSQSPNSLLISKETWIFLFKYCLAFFVLFSSCGIFYANDRSILWYVKAINIGLENSVYFVEQLGGSTTWPGHRKADENEKRFWTLCNSKLKRKKWRKGSDVSEWTGEICQRLKAFMKAIKTAASICLSSVMNKSGSLLLLSSPCISGKRKGTVSQRMEKAYSSSGQVETSFLPA